MVLRVRVAVELGPGRFATGADPKPHALCLGTRFRRIELLYGRGRDELRRLGGPAANHFLRLCCRYR